MTLSDHTLALIRIFFGCCPFAEHCSASYVDGRILATTRTVNPADQPRVTHYILVDNPCPHGVLTKVT